MKAFESEVIARVHLIRVPWHLDRAACDELKASGTQWKDLPVVLHVLDLSQAQTLKPNFYRAVAEFKSALQAKQANLVSINASSAILKQLEHDGMVQLFAPQQSMKEAITELGLYYADDTSGLLAVDREFLNPLEEGLRKSLQTFGLSDATFSSGEISPPRSIKDPDALEISLGAVGDISNGKMHGTVALYLTQGCLESVFAAATRKPWTSHDSARARDLVKELLNMAMGHAKAEWRLKRNISLTRSIPQAIEGDLLQENLHGFVSEAWILPLTSPQGSLYIGVRL